jgi:hypothetical protein
MIQKKIVSIHAPVSLAQKKTEGKEERQIKTQSASYAGGATLLD